MANDLIEAGFASKPISSVFANVTPNDELSAGVHGGFGIVGYKGKTWSLRHRGEETKLMREDGDGPRSSIEVVILKSSAHIAKIFYEAGYVEGSTAAPDCFSTNGVTPDVSSAKKQAATCATCPKNAWGSRVTPAGKQGKACSDSKRLAVSPLNDIKNEAFGGPLLLRVPAASLQDLAGYGQKMNALGYPYFAVATRVSFDPAEAYPKFLFKAIRPLTDEEAKLVLELRDSPQVARILSESEFTPAAVEAPKQALQSAFEQPPAQIAAPTVAVQTAATPQPVATAQVTAEVTKPAPVQAQTTVEPVDETLPEDLDAALDRLLPQ
jgi:hypothetical protein